MKLPEITIIGGGLAGLTSALYLSSKGFPVTVFEKRTYPFHRVCGEYISNEVLPFLNFLNVDVFAMDASRITEVHVSSLSGNVLKKQLDLGGFGISRYLLDDTLYQLAKKNGVRFVHEKVEDVHYEGELFTIFSSTKTQAASFVLGAFGKRSNLDQKLKRRFIANRSPYLGVKYHVKTDLPDHLISLHNFEDGYAGISKIENDTFCLCYLTLSDHLKKHKTIATMEAEVLMKNPYLKNIFEESAFIWEKPEVIHQISFASKPVIENHMLMLGDAAGMISPLCGNGMAIAMHAAKMVCNVIHRHVTENSGRFNRMAIELEYRHQWEKLFRPRLWAGRQIQKLFGSNHLTDFAVGSLKRLPPLSRYLIKKTHGSPF